MFSTVLEVEIIEGMNADVLRPACVLWSCRAVSWSTPGHTGDLAL